MWLLKRLPLPAARRAAVAEMSASLKHDVFPDLCGKLAALYNFAYRKLVEAFNQVAYAHGETFCADSIGGMFGIYFSEKVPTSFAEVSASNRDRFNKFFHAMLDAGVYLAPSAYEAGFVSVTHDDAVIEATKVAIDKAFAAIQ